MSDGDGYFKKNEEWEQPIQSSFTMSSMAGKGCRRALIRVHLANQDPGKQKSRVNELHAIIIKQKTVQDVEVMQNSIRHDAKFAAMNDNRGIKRSSENFSMR
ncbi:hypothetical protein J1N35_018332 [Gossypium stocksii]|uniref:Uncharacterized protein n=1 Tax=Gossypium stocksii TaxID=47602 RepID=A0A9D4A6Z5_9ROSI|nr:hypothetical protein J1N35_018332 [Gossypium stocksii]